MPDADITVELPGDSWQRFPTGELLLAEMRKRAAEAAQARGRELTGSHAVTTDKARGLYVATFGSKEADND